MYGPPPHSNIHKKPRLLHILSSSSLVGSAKPQIGDDITQTAVTNIHFATKGIFPQQTSPSKKYLFVSGHSANVDLDDHFCEFLWPNRVFRCTIEKNLSAEELVRDATASPNCIRKRDYRLDWQILVIKFETRKVQTWFNDINELQRNCFRV